MFYCGDGSYFLCAHRAEEYGLLAMQWCPLTLSCANCAVWQAQDELRMTIDGIPPIPPERDEEESATILLDESTHDVYEAIATAPITESCILWDHFRL